MFAGPNGSGKTTVKENLLRPADWFGIDINPDVLEKQIRETGQLSLQAFDLESSIEELRSHFASSKLMQSAGLLADVAKLDYHDGYFNFSRIDFNSYHASVLSDFLRRTALAKGKSFTFETVMSYEDKIDLLKEAQRQGFRTYLYYVATDDPQINIDRVKLRVNQGGHDVPVQKIIERYHRSLALLPQAIRHSNRAYFFDTSGRESWFFAESNNGNQIDLLGDEMPRWFEPIWQQF